MNDFNLTYINTHLDLKKGNVLNLFALLINSKYIIEKWDGTSNPFVVKLLKLYYDESDDNNRHSITGAKLHIEGDFNIYELMFEKQEVVFKQRLRDIEITLERITDNHVVLHLSPTCFNKGLLSINYYCLFPISYSIIYTNELEAKNTIVRFIKYAFIENIKKMDVLYKRMKNNKYSKMPLHFHCEILYTKIHCIANSKNDKDFVRLKKLFQYFPKIFKSTIQKYNKFNDHSLNMEELNDLICSFNLLNFFILKEALRKYQRSVSLDERNNFFANFYNFKVNLLCQHQEKEA